MPHRPALVDHLDASGPERRQVLARIGSGRLDGLDAAFDDRTAVFLYVASRRGSATKRTPDPADASS